VETDVAEDDDTESKDGDLIGLPPRPTKPISALFLYQKAHKKQSRKDYPFLTKDAVTKLLVRRYQELPKHKRHKYLRREKELRAIYNGKMEDYYRECRKASQLSIMGGESPTDAHGVDQQPPVRPEAITGEQLYHEKIYDQTAKKCEGDPKQIERALHCAWNKLNKTRREPHIKKAQIENETNIIAYNEAKKKYDAEMAKMKSSGNASSANLKTSMDMVIANKEQLMMNKPATRVRKKKFEGQPKRPPRNGYQLFNSIQMLKLTHLSHSEKFKAIGRLWSALDPEPKENFSQQAKRQQEKYAKEMEQWLKALSPEDKIDYDAQQEREKLEKKRGKTSSKTGDGAPTAKKAKVTTASKTKNTAVVAPRVKDEKQALQVSNSATAAKSTKAAAATAQLAIEASSAKESAKDSSSDDSSSDDDSDNSSDSDSSDDESDSSASSSSGDDSGSSSSSSSSSDDDSDSSDDSTSDEE